MDRFFDWFMDWSFKWVMGPTMVIMIVSLAAGIFVGIPYGIYAWISYEKPETFALRVDSWACSRSEVRTETYLILIGKVMVPQTRQYNHCIQWSER